MKKRIVKRLFAALLTGTFVCSALAGCGGAQSGGGAASDDTEIAEAIKKVMEDKEEVNITFWTGTGEANFPYLQAMVDAFEEEYPNITVELENQGQVMDLMDKLTQNIVSKTTPTISNISPSYFKEYIDSGAIIDMMPYFENEEIGFTEEEKNAIYPMYLEEAMSFGEDGTMYGFPTNKKTGDAFFYNKTYFDEKGWEAPATWDEVAQYSKVIKEETGVPGLSYDVAYPEAAFKMLSMQWGSEYLTEDGEADIDNEASREALKFYKENYDAGYFTMPSEMPSAGGNYSSDGFTGGECYMYVGAAAGAPYAVPDPEAGEEVFEVGIAPIPQKDDNNRIAFSKGEDYCIFSNATAEERVAAWLLIKYMSGDEANVDWLIATGNLPITNTMAEVPEYKAFLETENDGSSNYYKAAAVNTLLEMADYMQYERVSPVSAALAESCGTMWQSVIIGGKDIEAAMEQAVAEVEK